MTCDCLHLTYDLAFVDITTTKHYVSAIIVAKKGHRFEEKHYLLKKLSIPMSNFSDYVFNRVLRDTSPRFVGQPFRPLVCRSVCRYVTLSFFSVIAVFGLTAPVQRIK